MWGKYYKMTGLHNLVSATFLVPKAAYDFVAIQLVES